MRPAQPFGNLDTAVIMVIGHDPRLKESQAEAEYAFFMDYLTHSRPTWAPERSKYDLAEAVVRYVSELAGRVVALDELYVTNVCNEFLPPAPPRRTVLIPDEQGQRGVEAIAEAARGGHFRLILAMSPQPFYHLCRLGFIHDHPDIVATFIKEARPRAREVAMKAYVPAGWAPFLAVCGQRFHHCGVPVVPVLHVIQWQRLPTHPKLVKYRPLMEHAGEEVRAVLASEEKYG